MVRDARALPALLTMRAEGAKISVQSHWHEAREVAAVAPRRSHRQPALPTLRLQAVRRNNRYVIDPGGSQNRNALVFGLKTTANF
jgi:hypothetical protein